jgi:hypothetical protein
MPGWAPSRDRRYQLSNRFAWAWKLAGLGVPVVLVFLGVLDADEMANHSRRTFANLDEWRAVLMKHASGFVPDAAWGQRLSIGGVPVIPLIRSVRRDFEIE